MSTEFSQRGSTPALKTTPGLHRFRWDMRHEGVWDKDPARSGRSGPLAAPGVYTIRFKANGQTFQETINIKIDPKVEKNGVSIADLNAQQNLNLQVRDLRTKAKRTLVNIQDRKGKLNSGKSRELSAGEKKQVAFLENLESQFLTETGRYQQPMLLDQLNYLNRMIDAADQKPGDDTYQRYKELDQHLSKLIGQFRKSSMLIPKKSSDSKKQ